MRAGAAVVVPQRARGRAVCCHYYHVLGMPCDIATNSTPTLRSVTTGDCMVLTHAEGVFIQLPATNEARSNFPLVNLSELFVLSLFGS